MRGSSLKQREEREEPADPVVDTSVLFLEHMCVSDKGLSLTILGRERKSSVCRNATMWHTRITGLRRRKFVEARESARFMEHEITFQEVTGGGSSDVKSIEIKHLARSCVEYEREDVRFADRSIRAPACRYAPGNKSAKLLGETFIRNAIRETRNYLLFLIVNRTNF